LAGRVSLWAAVSAIPPQWYTRGLRKFNRHWVSLSFIPSRYHLILTLFTGFLFWGVVLVGSITNPDYRLSEQLSYLGTSSANHPWIFNAGVITTGSLLVIWSYLLIRQLEGLFEGVGLLLIFTSWIFLIFIGAFPYPKTFHTVSLTFFLTFVLTGGFLVGVGLILHGHRVRGGFVCAFPMLGVPFVIMIPWAPMGTLEVIVISLICACMLALRREAGVPPAEDGTHESPPDTDIPTGTETDHPAI